MIANALNRQNKNILRTETFFLKYIILCSTEEQQSYMRIRTKVERHEGE